MYVGRASIAFPGDAFESVGGGALSEGAGGRRGRREKREWEGTMKSRYWSYTCHGNVSNGQPCLTDIRSKRAGNADGPAR